MTSTAAGTRWHERWPQSRLPPPAKGSPPTPGPAHARHPTVDCVRGWVVRGHDQSACALRPRWAAKSTRVAFARTTHNSPPSRSPLPTHSDPYLGTLLLWGRHGAPLGQVPGTRHEDAHAPKQQGQDKEAPKGRAPCSTIGLHAAHTRAPPSLHAQQRHTANIWLPCPAGPLVIGPRRRPAQEANRE
jgi:hypothetical protein